MKNISPYALFSLLLFTALNSFGQTYRSAPLKINDLVHTRLDLHFDYTKCYVYGKAWLTLKPHFYSTDTLRLDAKGMDIENLSLVEQGKLIPLKFSYDSLTIQVHLNRLYRAKESYTVYIGYTAKPNQLKVANDAHGLYFINPTGSEKGKPTQIWTTGEPDYNSAWFPTIDEPNQKCTDEISLNVPDKYVTLSNGRLATQMKHPDGTRTDTWKMELPQAPYLFMIAVGDFQIVKDSWHGKPVDYYLEPQYAADAKAIFGYTPEAMTFFSKILGVDFPWNKYAQIRVRGFNGGMENTTATEFNEDGQSSPRELADLPYQSGNVHELFHQWFGDYVTCESWSNLPLNESFADLGEILWAERKYGQDVADEHIYQGTQGYLNNTSEWKENLIRFDYAKKQDMFDGVTYQKGGRILNMLRHYLGNAAFYKGLHIYLTEHTFGNADAQQLRLALEEASGLDLNWFFNQWFYGSGHPILDISYHWDAASHTESVCLKQTQEGNVFILPMAVDIYAGGKTQRYQIWMRDKADTLNFPAPVQPDLVNVDAEKTTIVKKTDHKTLSEFTFQYAHAPLYVDRCEAIAAAAASQTDYIAQHILIKALDDPYYGLRIKTMRALSMDNATLKTAVLPVLIRLAAKDTSNLARAEAIATLGKLKLPENKKLFEAALASSNSYSVQAAALDAIQLTDPKDAFTLAKKYEKGSKGKLRDAIIAIYCQSGGDAEWPYVYYNFANPASVLQYNFTGKFASLTGTVANPAFAQQGIEAIADLVIRLKKYDKLTRFIEILNQVKADRLKLNDTASAAFADQAISRMSTLARSTVHD
jgi:aminopeptidase N